MTTANKTFLELCQEMASEVGIPGGGPSTTVGQSGEYKRIVTYIQNADMDIQRMYADWNFMWSTFTGTTVINSNSITGAATDIRTLIRNRIWVNYGTASGSNAAFALEYKDWDEFVNDELASPSDAGQPVYCSMSPAGGFRIAPQPNAAYASKDVYVEYYKSPSFMTTDGATSNIPANYRRIIVARAILQYSFVEDAPEIQPGAVAEFDSILHQLEANYLPHQRRRLLASAEEAGYGQMYEFDGGLL